MYTASSGRGERVALGVQKHQTSPDGWAPAWRCCKARAGRDGIAVAGMYMLLSMPSTTLAETLPTNTCRSALQ